MKTYTISATIKGEVLFYAGEVIDVEESTTATGLGSGFNRPPTVAGIGWASDMGGAKILEGRTNLKSHMERIMNRIDEINASTITIVEMIVFDSTGPGVCVHKNGPDCGQCRALAGSGDPKKLNGGDNG